MQIKLNQSNVSEDHAPDTLKDLELGLGCNLQILLHTYVSDLSLLIWIIRCLGMLNMVWG